MRSMSLGSCVRRALEFKYVSHLCFVTDGAYLHFTSDGKKCRDVADPLWKLDTVVISFGLLGSINGLIAVFQPFYVLLFK